MYIRIDVVGFGNYRRLKALSFSPEADLTLSSLPVNGLTVEVITEDAFYPGLPLELYDDMDALWANYIVTKAERLNPYTARLTAQSHLTLLDRFTLGAEMFENVTVSAFVDRLFTDPFTGSQAIVPIDIDDYYSGVTVTGFCPEQTARERLQWLCLTIGALVRQCFCENLTIFPAPDVDAAVYYAKGQLIPLSDTFMRPSIAEAPIVRSVSVTGYENFTDVDPTEDESGDDESGDESEREWQSGEDFYGVTWWFNPVDWTFQNTESPELPGKTVSIDGVTLISGATAERVLGWLAAAYFRRGEIDLDCINNGRYFPGQKVRFYTDEGTVYTGYIKSCDFSFGLQARSRLTISSDLEKVPVGTITFTYRYGDLPLGKNTYTLPVDEPYSYDNPTITWYSGGQQSRYEPETPTSTGETPPGVADIPVNYLRCVPYRIVITTPPDKTMYLDGRPMDYTGMVVTAYDVHGNPWTNGGQYPDGIIPASALTLPTQTARMGEFVQIYITPSGVIPVGDVDINGPLYIKGVETVWVRSINPTGHGTNPGCDWEDVEPNAYMIGEYDGKTVFAVANTVTEGAEKPFWLTTLSDGRMIAAAEEKVTSGGSVLYQWPAYPQYALQDAGSSGGGNLTNTFTLDGKTVWYGTLYDWSNFPEFQLRPVTRPSDNGPDLAPYVAWYMVYGTLWPGMTREKIEVQFKQSGVTRSDYFWIDVVSRDYAGEVTP